jgi:hypothetical protein
MNASVTLFADDMELHVCGNTDEMVTGLMQAALERLSTYCSSNSLDVNVKKTKIMLPFSKASSSITCSYRGKTIDLVDTFKYLGVTLDGKLKFQDQVMNLIKRVKSRLYILRRSKFYCNAEGRRTLFFAFVYPLFDYALTAWFPLSLTLRQTVEILFRHCCRIVLNDSTFLPVISNIGVYRELEILPLHLQYQFDTAKLLFRIIRLNEVPALGDVLQWSPNCSTRSSAVMDLKEPQYTSERSRSSFEFCSCRLWNSIPSDIRNAVSQRSFEAQYMPHLLSMLHHNYEFNRKLYDFV